ncbi:MAG: hypothetical protein M3116_02465, partial [Actinomycetota bacterium]|nr:hypothetical protein [Actinomycetota bacterium]
MRSGILRHRLPRWTDPATAYSRLFRDQEDTFWLDSSDGSGRSWSGAGARLKPAVGGGAGLFDAAGAAIRHGTVASFGP